MSRNTRSKKMPVEQTGENTNVFRKKSDDQVLGVLKSPVFRDRTNTALVIEDKKPAAPKKGAKDKKPANEVQRNNKLKAVQSKNQKNLPSTLKQEPKIISTKANLLEKENAKKKVNKEVLKESLTGRQLRVKKAPTRDSSFKVQEKSNSQALVPSTKNLRAKSLKNYCDDSVVKESCDGKNVPIYRKLDPQVEEHKEQDVYDFFVNEDSPKLRTKAVRKQQAKKPLKKNNIPKAPKVPRIKKVTTEKVVKMVNKPLFVKAIEKLEGPKKINIIKSKIDNMMDHSLLRQSLSPIRKLNTENAATDESVENLPSEAFSRIKKVVQSTPQQAMTRVPNLRQKKMKTEELIKETLLPLENKTSSPTTGDTAPQMHDLLRSPRKFGTVLSNDMSPRSSITNSSKNSINSNVSSLVSESESVMVAIKSLSKSPVEQQISSILKAVENKENTKPHPTPEKSFKFVSKQQITTPKRRLSLRLLPKSPKKTNASLTKSDFREGSFQPEPGPSTRTSLKSTSRQSNLDNFLGLGESSNCNGIFHEPPSVVEENSKATEIDKLDIFNAFGFDDSEDITLSPLSTSTSVIATVQDVKKSKKGKVFLNARVKSSKNPVRPNPVEINKILRKRTRGKVEAKPPLTNVTMDSEEEFVEKKNSKKTYKTHEEALKDAVEFADTFDLGEKDKEEDPDKEVPLFVDLEPVHFNQPPRRSYLKRKRVDFRNYQSEVSDEENSEDGEEVEKKQKHKKKRLNKHALEEQRQMEEWVKNTNSTFDEIDNFDLVIQ